MRDDLNLMTWNVRYFGHGTKGLRATRAWMERLARALASLDPLPDLVALQEVETRSLRGGLQNRPQLERFSALVHEALAELGSDHSYQMLYFPAHSYEIAGVPPLYTTGLALLVSGRLVIEAHNAAAPDEITHVSLPALRQVKQRRIVAHARLRAPGGHTLDVFNTHLSLPGFMEVGPHRIPSKMGWGTNQVHEAANLLAHVARLQTSMHTVVMGDFNSLPASPVWQAMRRAGLVDAFDDHGGSERTRWATARFAWYRMHIDHIFSTPGLSWRSFADHTVDHGPLRALSDHAPKAGTVRLDRRSP